MKRTKGEEPKFRTTLLEIQEFLEILKLYFFVLVVFLGSFLIPVAVVMVGAVSYSLLDQWNKTLAAASAVPFVLTTVSAYYLPQRIIKLSISRMSEPEP